MTQENRASLTSLFDFPAIAPSILAADFTRLEQQLLACTEGGARWIHCDVMDGHFVPNISFGPLIIEAARRALPDAFLDTHLMISRPGDYIETFAKAGSNLITIHAEADIHAHRTLSAIRKAGCYTGIAINPGTSLSSIEELLPETDLVCIMSVNPGFGGQSFIPSALQKVERLVTWRREMGLNFLIEIDGGAGLSNTESITQTGTDIVVAGSSIFKADDIRSQTDALFRKALVGASNRG
ncbi:MAG: ribulose-phosphate 3-epimerase [Balneolales bacterium]|nr:ribulose-phosphate 3-epimerase [Balneolales bacterium]